MAPSAATSQKPSLEPNLWKIKSALLTATPDKAKIEQKNPRTIDELLRQISRENSQDPIFSYPFSGIDYVDYSAAQLDMLAFHVAQEYKAFIPQREFSQNLGTVVGLLGPSNFQYFISILALTKLGHTVLFLSTRISTAAYVSLLQQTEAVHILIDPSFNETASEVKGKLPMLQVNKIASKSTYDDVNVDLETDTQLCGHLDPNVESSKIAWIIHSSGSTGLPKPIYQTHKAALNNYASNLNLRGFITLPLYHAHGISSVFRALHSRKQIYMYNATLPLSQQYLLGIMKRYRFDIFYGVPYALKVLSESPEGLTALAELKVVMFGGSACSDALGDKLVRNGVNLISHYGTTETGQLMTSFREAGDKAWDYVRVPESFNSYLKFEMKSLGIYELVALDGLPSKVASNRPDGSYATKDLFTPHTSIPNAWKYFARLDDTIVLMNGEKVIPTAFEQSIRHQSYVREAVMFGTGKDRVGMLIIPSASSRKLAKETLENSIVAAIEYANLDMPAYAQLGWEMVRILCVGTEYPQTDKGTVIREAFYREFQIQIDEIYKLSEISCGDLALSEPELKQYLRTELTSILSPTTAKLLNDNTDFFSIGIDSLQAIRLRNAISKNIQTNGIVSKSNVIFDFPTIDSLAKELYRIRIGGESKLVSAVESMKDLISKYSKFEAHLPVSNTSTGHYLVVTGATGSLGVHLISQLLLQQDVHRIYCLVRATSPQNAHTRVIKSMQDRSVYGQPQIKTQDKIVAVPGDFSTDCLGLSSEIYHRISSELTGIIHCAWSVNFNLMLGSFEADCIVGSHHLINLCLKAKRPEPATFNLCSSVSAVARTKGCSVPEALPESLEYAQDMGYAQSKLVTEHICVNAARSYGVKMRVLRVGQIVADTIHGIWNATEAIPLILQAAVTIGAVPKLDESPLWLPVDTVASTIAEISLSSTGAGVMNIVNHQSFHWTRDLLPALHNSGLNFFELDQKDWIEALRKSNQDPVANPPIKLLDFFARKYDNEVPRGDLAYETSLARSLSPSLAAAPILDQNLVDKFVRYFLKTAWTSSSASSLS